MRSLFMYWHYQAMESGLYIPDKAHTVMGIGKVHWVAKGLDLTYDNDGKLSDYHRICSLMHKHNQTGCWRTVNNRLV